MEICTILFEFIFIYSQLIFHGLQALKFGNYPEGVQNSYGLALTGIQKFDRDNSASNCASYSKEKHFIFSVTKMISTGFFSVSETPGLAYFIPAPELKNYPECVQNSNGSALIGVEKRNRDNSASNCASYCKEKNFIFSGTMNFLCICGNALTIGIRTSSRCETRCPGNTTETCGGEDSVSLRRTGYESGTTRSPKPSGAETSSEINVSPKTDESGTTRSPKQSGAETSSEKNVSPKTDESGTTMSPKQPGAETSSEINVSPKTDTNTCAEKRSQLIAVYITLPVVVILAGSAALIVHLVLRHRRLAKEASVRQQDLSCHITYDLARNIMLDHHPYQALHREINRYMYAESLDERITEEDKCGAGYITPVFTNDTVDDVQIFAEPMLNNATIRTYTNYPD